MNEVSDDIEAEKHNQKGQEEIHKFREYDKPLLHFIFSLNLHEGSFVDLENIEGGEKYIELHTLLFNDFFECKVFPTEENQDQKPIMTEQFLMRYLHGRSFESIRRCTYHGVTFDVWSDGKEFEIIVDPNEFDRRDYLVKSFFACWAGEALVKTLNLDEFVRPNSIQDKHEIYCEEYLGYKSYYDCVLSLDYTSFIIYTYPSGTKFENDIDEKYIRKISENMWTNGGIFLRDRYYPPFQRCNVYIAGHYFEDYPSETREYLRFLDSHMKYGSMIFTLENFMGIISSFPDTPDFQQVQVRKWDALEDLLGRKINHSYLSFLRKMRDDLHDFSYYGLGSNFRGLEEDASTQYTPRYIAGEYLHYFTDDDISFTKKVISRVDKDSINKLKEDLDNFWGDLTDRINAFINKTRSQENAFYRTYEIKLSVRTQQLTLLSIIVAIIIYLLTTLPSAFR